MARCRFTTIDADPAPSGVVESSSRLGSLLVSVICSSAAGTGPERVTVPAVSRFCPTVTSLGTSPDALACPNIQEGTKIERATTVAGHTYRIIINRTYAPKLKVYSKRCPDGITPWALRTLVLVLTSDSHSITATPRPTATCRY